MNPLRGIIYLLLGAPLLASAAIEPVCWFSDHMVLQRNLKVPVWGFAATGETVTVEFQDQRVSATTNKDGEWKVHLAPMSAGGPYDMKLSGSTSSDIQIKDILIGDVWICAGQSNMQRSFLKVDLKTPPETWEYRPGPDLEELPPEGQPLSNIRLFQVGHNGSANPVRDIPKDDTWGPFERTNANTGVVPQHWREASRENLGLFSRVGFIFGKRLNEELDVPIGLIRIAMGSTSITQWSSPEVTDHFLKRTSEPTPVLRYREKRGGFDAEHNGTYSDLYNGIMYPLLGFGIKGFIWWQGENDSAGEVRYGSTRAYAEGMFSDMITDYRSKWGQGDFPFLFVQLQNHSVRGPGMLVRDYQMHALSLPNTAMVVSLDKCATIHPPYKIEVANRLSTAALALAYGKEGTYCGPIYDRARVVGDTIHVSFQHIGSGLVKGNGLWTNPKEALSDAEDDKAPFEIRTADGPWVKANAELVDNEVRLSAPGISHPAYAAYAMNHVDPQLTVIKTTLFNQEGFPASPFSTDTWPGLSSAQTPKAGN